MVRKELSEASERLTTRRKLHKKAIRRGNFFRWVGSVLFLFSLIPIIPGVIDFLFGPATFLFSWVGGSIFGLLLERFGNRINRRVHAPPGLILEEEDFLKVVETLKNIDTYQKEGIEFSKIEAIKNLSKVGEHIKEPAWSLYSLWKALTKDVNNNLRLLKQNLKERLIPNIEKGEKEDVDKAYAIIEVFAKYLLNPTISQLMALNDSMSDLKLPSLIVYAPSKSPSLFDRHPKLRHFLVILIFGFCGIFVFHLGINFLYVSVDTAYISSTATFGALTAAYITAVIRKG